MLISYGIMVFFHTGSSPEGLHHPRGMKALLKIPGLLVKSPVFRCIKRKTEEKRKKINIGTQNFLGTQHFSGTPNFAGTQKLSGTQHFSGTKFFLEPKSLNYYHYNHYNHYNHQPKKLGTRNCFGTQTHNTNRFCRSLSLTFQVWLQHLTFYKKYNFSLPLPTTVQIPTGPLQPF